MQNAAFQDRVSDARVETRVSQNRGAEATKVRIRDDPAKEGFEKPRNFEKATRYRGYARPQRNSVL